MTDADVEKLFRDRRLHAGLAWVLVGFLGLVVVEGVVAGELLWAGFAGAVCLLSLLPVVAYRHPEVMLPWEVVEFAIAEIALATGAPGVLTQYSLGDTMKDLLFNLMGGAVWKTAHPSDIVSVIESRLDARAGTE
jgi:hypothetical protein